MKHSLYYSLLDCLLHNFYISTTLSEPDERTWKNVRLEDIIRYINGNYWRHLSMQEIADKVHMSYVSFSKYFKKNVGVSFIEYLNNVRLHFAVEELLNSNKQITEIAVDHGFTSPSLFNKMFKKVYHMSPSQYRSSATQQDVFRPEEKSEDYTKLVEKYFIKIHEEDPKEVFERKIAIDVSQYREFGHVWNRAIGVGSAFGAMSANLRKAVHDYKKTLGYKYIRIANIFSREMNMRSGHETVNLNFESIDSVLDFIVDEQLFPIIDFGNKPGARENHSMTDASKAVSEALFLKPGEFELVLGQLMNHVLRRYGIEEIEQWIYEFWYDAGEDRTIKNYDSSMGTYMEYFKIFRKVIKTIAPEAKVGGVGIAVDSINDQFDKYLPMMGNLDYHPDFISVYCYPYQRVPHGKNMSEARPNDHTECIKYAMEKYHKLAKGWGIDHIDAYITEWNMSMFSHNSYNDSCGKAALMLKNMVDMAENVTLGCYSMLRDTDTGRFMQGEVVSGSIGLLCTNGIKKPAYYALHFFNRLGKYIIDRGDGYIATTDGRDNYQILCFNYKKLSYRYYMKEEYRIDAKDLPELFEDRKMMRQSVVLNHVQREKYSVKTYIIREHTGSILHELDLLGVTRADREDIQYLDQACTPEMRDFTVEASHGQLILDMLLNVFEMRFYSIKPEQT